MFEEEGSRKEGGVEAEGMCGGYWLFPVAPYNCTPTTHSVIQTGSIQKTFIL